VVRGTPGILELPGVAKVRVLAAAAPEEGVCEPGDGKEDEAAPSSISVSVNG